LESKPNKILWKEEHLKFIFNQIILFNSKIKTNFFLKQLNLTNKKTRNNSDEFKISEKSYRMQDRKKKKPNSYESPNLS